MEGFAFCNSIFFSMEIHYVSQYEGKFVSRMPLNFLFIFKNHLAPVVSH